MAGIPGPPTRGGYAGLQFANTFGVIPSRESFREEVLVRAFIDLSNELRYKRAYRQLKHL